MSAPDDQDDGVFPLLLSLLKEECEKDAGAASLESPTYRASVSTMLKLLRNVEQNPSEEKYRKIRLGNKAFAEKVWKYEGAQQFLQAAGWVVLDDCIVLTEDSNVSPAVQELEKEQSRLQPATSAPSQPTSSPPKKESKEITESRKRQMEAMKREKDEKKRIAEQIQADREEIRTRRLRDSRARERRFGANIKRFEDIGVDLNGGGG